jgi:hypothetical protein
MADDAFKLPGSSYDELCRIIQGYKKDKPSSLEDVSKYTVMNTSVISRNNGFLTAVGVIEGGVKKTLTDVGDRLSRALRNNYTDEIKKSWREIVLASEFLSNMLAAIRIRRGMDVTTFQNHVIYSANQTRTTNTMAGVRAIMEIFANADLVTEEDGKLIALDQPSDSDQTLDENRRIAQQLDLTEAPGQIIHEKEISTSYRSKNLTVNIQIRLDIKPDELDGLGSKLRQFISEVSEINTNNKPSGTE